jgi:chitinase
MDEVKCYDSGQVAKREHLTKPVYDWCDSMNKDKLKSKYFSGTLRTAFPCCDRRDEVVPIEVKWSVEVHDGCEWTVNAGECKAEFRKIIDGCDRNTADRKQGGRLVGDCMTWRVDPNRA